MGNRPRRRRHGTVADTGAGFVPVVVEALEPASEAAPGRMERLLGQLELELDELTAKAAEDDLAAETAPGCTTQVKAFERRRPSHKPFPEHLPRERVMVAVPTSCTCCGSKRRSKVGEDVTETLEVIPRRWKVIQTVREKFSCRDCEKLSQAPAPYHAVPRGWAGPNLLATIVFEKYGQHQPLNRQSERYAREGVELSLSTLADQGGVRLRAPSVARAHRGRRAGGAAPARRRHAGSGAREGQDRHRAGLGLHQRRHTVRRTGPAGGTVPLLAHPFRFTPGGASAQLCRAPSGHRGPSAPGRVPPRSGPRSAVVAWSSFP